MALRSTVLSRLSAATWPKGPYVLTVSLTDATVRVLDRESAIGKAARGGEVVEFESHLETIADACTASVSFEIM